MRALSQGEEGPPPAPAVSIWFLEPASTLWRRDKYLPSDDNPTTIPRTSSPSPSRYEDGTATTQVDTWTALVAYGELILLFIIRYF
jgi:hypothetical protein